MEKEGKGTFLVSIANRNAKKETQLAIFYFPFLSPLAVFVAVVMYYRDKT